MIPRRDLVAAGLLGGVIEALAAPNVAAAEPGGGGGTAVGGAEVTDATVNRIVQALADLRAEIRDLRSFSDISPVREAQLQYLRANGRLPGFIEVGTTPWYGVHDWHVRWQHPFTVGRDALGRYTITMQQTLVIMRPDAAPGFIGVPYDNP